MKAVIPVGGRGTRFHPWTHINAKELIPVVDMLDGRIRAAIDLVVKEAYMAGITDALLITAIGKSSIKDHLTKQQQVGELSNDIRLHYTDQKEPKGLGDAVLCAESYTKHEPFVVLLGDDFHDKNPILQMRQVYDKIDKEKFGGIVITQKVELENAKRYGVLTVANVGEIFEVKAVVEKPEHPESPYVISGRYLLSNFIFDYIKKTLPDKKGEIQLTNAIKLMLADGYKFYAVELEGKRYDVGEASGWFRTIKEIGSNFYNA
ncbi:MAG: sugar phosphate nucleotidyltransferase [Nanoarchaeota archaeon]